MQSMPHEYHETQIARLAMAFAPFAQTKQAVVPKIYIAAGQPIYSGHELEEWSYVVTSGEVLILRDERPIDLVEAGELLDLTLWPGTTAVALSSCTLEVIQMLPCAA